MDQEAFKRNSLWCGMHAQLVALPSPVKYRLLYNDQNSHISRAANVLSGSNSSLLNLQSDIRCLFTIGPRLVSHWRLFTCES